MRTLGHQNYLRRIPAWGTEIRHAIGACREHLVAAAIFSLGINLLYLALPLYMLQVYDRVLSSGSVSTLVMLTLACLIALLTLAALDLIRARVLVRSGLRLDDRLAGRVLTATLERANLPEVEERGQALRDLDAFRQVATGPGIHALFDAPWTPVYIAVIYMVHPLLGTKSLGCALLLLLLALLNEYVTRRAVTVGNTAVTRLYSDIEASVRNAEVIHALGMLSVLVQRWLAARRTVLALQSAASDRSAWISATIKFVRLFMQAIVLGCGAYLVIDHSISAGAMFASAIILGRALQPIEQLVGTWRQLIVARDAMRRVTKLLDDFPQTPSRVSLPRPSGRLEVERLSYLRPNARKPVLNGISFSLDAGESLGIIGPTAAGKSTLARLLVGVLRPHGGAVRLDGAEIATRNRAEFGQCSGYLPQDVELFSGSIAENIARFRNEPSAAVVEAATLAGAHDLILGLPEGYDTQVGDGGSLLSGGQRQRIALARAVYGRPSLVVLDEPNSNLDAAGEAALNECLRQLKQARVTVVIVSHRINVLNCVDKVLQLQDGLVEAFGTRDEFIARLRQAHKVTGMPGPNTVRSGAHYG